MGTEHAWNTLRIFKAGMLTLFSILLSALFGAVWMPLTHNLAADGTIWLLLVGGLCALHLRAAYRFHRRAAEKEGLPVETLAILADVAYEAMALTAGGFFGVLLAAGAWSEYGKTGFGGNTPLMAGLALLPIGAFVFALARLVRYLRAASDATP